MRLPNLDRVRIAARGPAANIAPGTTRGHLGLTTVGGFRPKRVPGRGRAQLWGALPQTSECLDRSATEWHHRNAGLAVMTPLLRLPRQGIGAILGRRSGLVALDAAIRRVGRAAPVNTAAAGSWLSTRCSSLLGPTDMGFVRALSTFAAEDAAIDLLTAVV